LVDFGNINSYCIPMKLEKRHVKQIGEKMRPRIPVWALAEWSGMSVSGVRKQLSNGKYVGWKGKLDWAARFVERKGK
jgi:hypothetical protein